MTDNIKDFGYDVIIKGNYIKTTADNYVNIHHIESWVARDSFIDIYAKGNISYPHTVGFGYMGVKAWKEVLEKIIDYIATLKKFSSD